MFCPTCAHLECLRNCLGQVKERLARTALKHLTVCPPTPSPALPTPSVPRQGLTRAGHTPDLGAGSTPLSSPLSPCPPQPPWSAPSIPSCSQSFCPGDTGRKRIKEKRGRGVSGGRGQTWGILWSLVTLPAIPRGSAGEHRQQKQLWPGQEEMPFLSGAGPGDSGATSPWDREREKTEGQLWPAGWDRKHSWKPKTKGQKVRSRRGLHTKLLRGHTGEGWTQV